MSGLIGAIARLSGPLAYLAIGTLAALEAAAFVGLLIPGELAMLLGGFPSPGASASRSWPRPRRSARSPATRWATRSGGAPGRFLADRLDPGQERGLSLTVGLAALSGLGWAFGGILQDVLGREELASVDSPVTSWLVTHREPWLTRAMQVATSLGSLPVVLGLLTVASVVVVLSTQRWQPAAVLAVILAGTVALVYPVKLLVGRARPGIGESLGPFVDSAFPSGHSVQAIACYGALAYLVARLPGGALADRRSRRVRARRLVAGPRPDCSDDPRGLRRQEQRVTPRDAGADAVGGRG